MWTYILKIPSRLRKYSETIDYKSQLVGKTWLLANEDGVKESIIFNNNGTLYHTLNGVVSDGNWTIIPHNKDIIISLADSKLLFNSLNTNSDVIALQLDGRDTGMLLISEDYVISQKLISALGAKNFIEQQQINEELEKKRLEEEKRRFEELQEKIKQYNLLVKENKKEINKLAWKMTLRSSGGSCFLAIFSVLIMSVALLTVLAFWWPVIFCVMSCMIVATIIYGMYDGDFKDQAAEKLLGKRPDNI